MEAVRQISSVMTEHEGEYECVEPGMSIKSELYIASKFQYTLIVPLCSFILFFNYQRL